MLQEIKKKYNVFKPLKLIKQNSNNLHFNGNRALNCQHCEKISLCVFTVNLINL